MYCREIEILSWVVHDWQLYFNSRMMVLVLKKCSAWPVKLSAFSFQET
jgi:hypothetical protein